MNIWFYPIAPEPPLDFGARARPLAASPPATLRRGGPTREAMAGRDLSHHGLLQEAVMSRPKWPPAKTAELLQMAAQGLCRREIAQRMGLQMNAVITKLHLMGVAAPAQSESQEASCESAPVPGVIPRYEDVTCAEAAAISKGAPRSARLSRSSDYALTRYSLFGNSGEMCAP
jgi:hypothetical protein